MSCFTVEARLKFKDEEKFCNLVHRMAMSYRLYGVGSKEFDTPFKCFDFICFGLAEQKGDCWTGEFEAMALYEQVLIDTFYVAAEALDVGSEIYIAPDDTCFSITVTEDGVICKEMYTDGV